MESQLMFDFNNGGDLKDVEKMKYEEFVEKFKTKKTKDDCFTPANVYNAVAEWVVNEYNVDRRNFVRPFYPGGDYESEKYKPTDIVVDNPPFSILSKIIRFYLEKGIPFFLFAPTLTLFSGASFCCCAICAGCSIEYTNGAIVNTSFVTSLEECRFRSAPTLYDAVFEENKKNQKKKHKQIQKYEYPNELVTAAFVGKLSKYGIDFSVSKEESERISALDSQRKKGKVIFGEGYLISKKAAAEKAAAEKAAATVEKWELSKREKAIVDKLSQEREVENERRFFDDLF